MRFSSAREAGLTESTVELVTDAALDKLTVDEQRLVELTDAIVGLPQALTAQQIEGLRSRFNDAELTELVLGIGLFHGMSKVLITLGLEPEQMDTTVIPTPGSS